MSLPPGVKQTAEQKLARIAVRVPTGAPLLHKPPWIRIRLPHDPGVRRLRELIREQQLHTVCEEASCPNLPECFGHGTATFMILGDVCTRRCPFCDVAHGRPLPVDLDEPQHLAQAIAKLQLRYVVLTSVDRDDLHDGGAAHFVHCLQAVRQRCPSIRIEILVPDFRGRLTRALDAFECEQPDVFNHNLETVPALYRAVRPGADYAHSLALLEQFGQRHPGVPTKSGLMLGLGETPSQVREVLQDLRSRGCQMLTLGQYLQPTRHHLPVVRYVEPAEFEQWQVDATALGFAEVASGPMVRSSYHADRQAAGMLSANKAQAAAKRSGVPTSIQRPS